ncbi:MAG: nucleotidyltransferase domain-containing protein [Desulforegulaceae bacterium]|nr:nucleotidyltransferase domain-containing protein [Desulforegulaceae bacterium]
MCYGLKQTTIESIKNVFSRYLQVEQVIIYGSRAKGNYKNGSDIDLTLKGDGLSLILMNKIAIELDDLLLPYTFDLSVYNHIENYDLTDHIQRVGKIFYKRKEKIGQHRKNILK